MNMLLSIFNDFCSWWAFWWVLPFVLGILLGRILNGKQKSRIAELEGLLDNERKDNLACQKLVKNAESERRLSKNIIASLEKEKENILAKQKAISPTANEAIARSKAPIVQTAEKVGTHNKGNYTILRSSNLQVIEGIGPKMEAVLKENGINDWAALAEKSQGELRAILDKYGGRYSIVDPKKWSKQAKLAAKQKWDKLIKFQKEEDVDSKLERIMIKLGIK